MATDAPAIVPSAPPTQNEMTSSPAEPAQAPAQKGTPNPSTNAAPAATADTDGSKKLSGAELKAKAKAEKQARRAQQKTVNPPAGPTSGAGPQQSQGGQQGKQGKTKVKQQDGAAPAGGAPGAKAHQGKQVAVPTPVVKDDRPVVPECYSHMSMARRIRYTEADEIVHPAVLTLGQQMSAFMISDSTARLEATLLAFKKVINSYTTPEGATLSRHFTSHVLNPQIEYLAACRPMCFSMGNAIRWLKLQVSKVEPDITDYSAKKQLCEAIDSFLSERVHLADLVIAETAADLITNGDVVLTYGSHPLVEKAILQAHKEDQKTFSVSICDDQLETRGKILAKKLITEGIPVTYIPDLSALRAHLREADIVLLGAEAMFSNGAMYARAGSCDVAIAAADLGVHVVGLSETINFTERVAMDSLTYNEIDPERHTHDGIRLLFDTTPDHRLNAIVTELGSTATASVAAVLVRLEEL